MVLNSDGFGNHFLGSRVGESFATLNDNSAQLLKDFWEACFGATGYVFSHSSLSSSSSFSAYWYPDIPDETIGVGASNSFFRFESYLRSTGSTAIDISDLRTAATGTTPDVSLPHWTGAPGETFLSSSVNSECWFVGNNKSIAWFYNKPDAYFFAAHGVLSNPLSGLPYTTYNASIGTFKDPGAATVYVHSGRPEVVGSSTLREFYTSGAIANYTHSGATPVTDLYLRDNGGNEDSQPIGYMDNVFKVDTSLTSVTLNVGQIYKLTGAATIQGSDQVHAICVGKYDANYLLMRVFI